MEDGEGEKGKGDVGWVLSAAGLAFREVETRVRGMGLWQLEWEC